MSPLPRVGHRSRHGRKRFEPAKISFLRLRFEHGLFSGSELMRTVSPREANSPHKIVQDSCAHGSRFEFFAGVPLQEYCATAEFPFS